MEKIIVSTPNYDLEGVILRSNKDEAIALVQDRIVLVEKKDNKWILASECLLDLALLV